MPQEDEDMGAAATMKPSRVRRIVPSTGTVVVLGFWTVMQTFSSLDSAKRTTGGMGIRTSRGVTADWVVVYQE